MIKLIATDIDGTLLEEGTIHINPEYFQVIEELKQRGVIFVAASGRQRHSIKRVFDPIKEELITISENGTCIHAGEFQYVNQIDPEIVVKYINEVRQIDGCEIGMNHDNMSYFDTTEIYQLVTGEYGYLGKKVDDITKHAKGTCKITTYHAFDATKTVGEEFMNRWGEKMHVTASGIHWVDMTNKGANKGTALKKLQEHYGISPEETLAFGDNDNDIEMLQRAEHSFAVATAREKVKEVANFVAGAHTEDGVLQVLKAVLRGELC